MNIIKRIDDILQDFFISVLSIFYPITSKISRTNRIIYIQVICILIPVYFVLLYSRVTYALPINIYTMMPRHLIGGCMIIMITILSIDRKLTAVKWRKIIVYPMMLSGVGIMIISFVHPLPEGYRLFASMMLFHYPALMFVWLNRRDYETLFECIARAIIIVGIVYTIICLIILAKGQGFDPHGIRFQATMSHAGNFSQFYSSFICCSLYMWFRNYNKRNYMAYGACALIGTGVGMLLLGQGRSCILACGACFIVSTVFFFRNIVKSDETFSKKKIIAFMLIIILSGHVFAHVPLLFNLDARDYRNENETEELGHNYKPNDRHGSIDRLVGNSANDTNQYSSGRIDLWNKVFNNIRFWGNDATKKDIKSVTNDNWKVYAHNVFLEISFYCGVPIGIIFIFIEFIAGVIALRYVFGKRDDSDCLIFSTYFYLLYLFQSMLDCASMPFIIEHACYYYFALIPMIDRGK